MSGPIVRPGSKFRRLTLIAGGYLAILYAALCIVTVLIGLLPRQMAPYLSGRSQTPTPSIVPTPHILVHKPSNSNSILFEGFSSNSSDWGTSRYAKVEVFDGKLMLQANASGYYAIAAGDFQQPVPPSPKYYVQADFASDIDTNQPFGLVFGMDFLAGTFYLFEILPQTRTFRLIKHTPAKWSELTASSSSAINSYPEANTLSVYFDQGAMELYLNGSLVSSYSDPAPFQFNGFGVYANDFGFRLIVDNVFVYYDK